MLLEGTALYSQDTGFIQGRLINAANEESIPFATIRIKNRTVGVISSLDGRFRVPKRFESMGDTLIISCMGC